MAASDDMRRWVETWKQAGPELAAIRREEIRVADNMEVIASLAEAFNHACTLPLRTGSGMLEMQRMFAKLR
jgi:hypothetical protein